jgi:hypothetical protein
MNNIFKYKDSAADLIKDCSLNKPVILTLTLVYFILTNSCISQFIPQTTQDQNLLVVEGLITDQPGNNTIKINSSVPLGGKYTAVPVSGCNVSITDDVGNAYYLHETGKGIYVADQTFQGVIGRYYTLHILTNSLNNNLSYQSSPVLMKPVPPIDSVYAEMRVITQLAPDWPTGEGVQIYLSTHDPENSCRFYRWEYVETWEFMLPYIVPNNICWINANSDKISIKSTSSLSEDRIERFPLNLVTNKTDRLKIKYSILVNQYSLNQEEFSYWEKLKNLTEDVGSLYDIIPSSIPSNILCVEKPDEDVLGYFSVSAVKSKRIFIKDQFRGMPDLYVNCPGGSVLYNDPIPNLNVSVWVIVDHPLPPPGFKVLTYIKGCADCTVRGSKIKPDYWDNSK